MESEFTTDVGICYLETCANNDALKCALLRIQIGTDGICMGYEPIVEEE
jgi:hypothetical protein